MSREYATEGDRRDLRGLLDRLGVPGTLNVLASAMTHPERSQWAGMCLIATRAAERTVELLSRKISHGCIDATCPQCDRVPMTVEQVTAEGVSDEDLAAADAFFDKLKGGAV